MAPDMTIAHQQTSPCRIIPFPLARRVGAVREVTAKLLTKRSEKSADTYRNRIAISLFAQLDTIGLPEAEQDEAVGAFFHAIEQELMRHG